MESTDLPAKPSELDTNKVRNQMYEIDGNKVTVSWKEFSPTKEHPTDEAVIFFPGWSAGNSKTLEDLTKGFAEDSGRKALSVTTRANEVIPDSLYQEAKALRQMIVEKGLKKLTLAGHSEGGTKAVNLVDILQRENPEIDIQGLILLDPVGLYEQGKFELARKFTTDTLVTTPITITKDVFKNPSLVRKGFQAGTDIIFNMVREMGSTRLVGYPKKLWSQISEMAKANTHYQDVTCPVVLIQGEKDPISSHKRVIPTDQIVEPQTKEDPVILLQRRKILKETFFPNSPQVDMLVPRKVGHHGIPHFRSEQIAKVSLGLLDRYWRNANKPAVQTTTQNVTV